MTKKYREWFEEVTKDFKNHTLPSKLTLEKFTNINNNIENLKTSIELGFAGIHTRQDKTNGNVKLNTNWRLLVTGGLVITNLTLMPIAFILIKELISNSMA